MHYIDGVYYMYYAISSNSKSTSAIGVASSMTMDAGTWEDHGSVGVGSDNTSDYNAIDANFIRIDGKPYLNFGSYFSGIQQVELLDPLSRWNSSHPHQIAFNSTGVNQEEGAFLYQHGDHYFLLFSSGINTYPGGNKIASGDEYRIVVCRSDNGTEGFVSCRPTVASAVLLGVNHIY